MIDIIKKYEGFRSKPYLCPANVVTIGYGSTTYPNGTKVTLKDKEISEKTATDMLLSYINKNIIPVMNSCIKTQLNVYQTSAIISFIYNVGPGNFKSSTLLKMINIDPDDIDIKEQFLRWNKAGGKVLKGLTNRRSEEAELYFTK